MDGRGVGAGTELACGNKCEFPDVVQNAFGNYLLQELAKAFEQSYQSVALWEV